MSTRAATTTGAVSRALREAIVTMLATLATLWCAMEIDPEPGPAVLAVVLCLSFSRSHLDRDLPGRLEAAVALPLVGLIAVGVGTLLHRVPWVGAAAFVAGMFVSIWLRRFGPMARRAGSLIALPFVAILTTPYVPTRHTNHVMAMLVPMIVALLAGTARTAQSRPGWRRAIQRTPAVPSLRNFRSASITLAEVSLWTSLS